MLLRCLQCDHVGEVMSVIPVRNGRLIQLDCGHTSTYDVGINAMPREYEWEDEEEPDMGKHVPWLTAICRSCGSKFMPVPDDARREFCPICREDLGIHTGEDAVEFLRLYDKGAITAVTQAERRALKGKVVPIKAAEPVNPEVVAEAVKQLIDYQVAPFTEFAKPITYVMYKNGLFEVRHSDLATVYVETKDVLGLDTICRPGIHLNLPKVPLEMLKQTISFFRGVCQRQNSSSEALVQIWWDRQDKRHFLYIPEQQASGGSVKPTSCFDQDVDGRWLRVGDIHSHGTAMSAHFSGIDNADEESITTERIFGVIGKVAQPIPEWDWRMRTRGGFIPLNVVDIFDIPTQDFTFTITSERLFKSINDKTAFKDGQVVLSCPVDPFTDVEIPEEWYARVKGWTAGHGQGHFWDKDRTPAMMKGYVFINGEEYMVEDYKMTPTGHRLVKKGEVTIHG